MKKVSLLVSGMLVIAVSLSGVLAGCKKQEAAKPVSEKIPVRITPAVRGDISDILSLSGNIESDNTAEVFPKISGRVENVTVHKGDIVKPGDELAVLEHSAISEQVKQFEAAQEAARFQLKQLEINLANLSKERERTVTLAEAGALSQQKKDDIETRFQAMKEQQKQVQAQVKQTDALLEQSRIQEREATLKSPTSGFVAECYLEIGDMATPAKPAFRIVRIDAVKIMVYIPEQEVSRVNTKTTARVTVDAVPETVKDPLEGKINRIAPTLDPRTRSVEIEIGMDNPAYKLKPGMSARVELTLDAHSAVFIVPQDYIVTESGNDFIFLVKGGKIKKQLVKRGIQSKGKVEIAEGLAESDQVITTTGTHLKDGSEVEIIKELLVR